MFNFNVLVSDLLTEQPQQQNQGETSTPPQTNANDAQNIMKLAGFKELINAYTTQYGKAPDVNEILKASNIITGGKYVAAKYTNLGYIPFIDAFAQSYSKIDDKDKSNFTQTDIINYIVNNSQTFDPIFNDVAAKLKFTNNVQEYEPSNADVNRAWLNLTAETNKLSQTAIQSLAADSIHTAISKIIAKRIPIIDRVMGVKGLVRPFNKSVITPVLQQFKRYTGYKQGDAFKNPLGWLKDRSWPKKISGDFSKMVEDISANNLLNVAVLAYEYYIYLLSTQGKPLNAQNQNTTDNQMRLPGFENTSLNLFDKFINSVILEYNPLPSHYQNIQVPTQSQTTTGSKKQPSQHPEAIRSRNRRAKAKNQTQQPQQQNQPQETKGLPPEQIEKISSQVGNSTDADYTSFLDDGVSRYLPDIKFDLGTISKDPSREARALYKALTDMAYFVRKTPGAKERLKYAGQAMSAFASAAVGPGGSGPGGIYQGPG